MFNMSRDRNRIYVGINNDEYAGMTPTGNIIKDAWVFGILPETETYEVLRAWQPYGHLVSKLPSDLFARHQKIYDEALLRAKQLGWSPELSEDD